MKIKKVMLYAVDILSVCVILCAVAVLLTVVFTGSNEVPSIFGYSVFRVMTGSMAPEIPLDALIVVRQTDPQDLREGDIISFYSSDPSLDGAVNTHRIVSVDNDGEAYYFTTRGDANNVDDHYLTTEDDLIGKVVFSSYQLGKIVRLVSNPLIFIPLIILPLALMFLANIYQTVSLAKQIAKEEEEAAVLKAVETIREKQKKG